MQNKGQVQGALRVLLEADVAERVGIGMFLQLGS